MAEHLTQILMSVVLTKDSLKEIVQDAQKAKSEIEKPIKITFDASYINKFEKALDKMQEKMQNLDIDLGVGNIDYEISQLDNFKKAFSGILEIWDSFDDSSLTDSQRDYFGSFIKSFQTGIDTISDKINEFPNLLKETANNLPSLNEKIRNSLSDGSISLDENELRKIRQELRESRDIIGGSDKALYDEADALYKSLTSLIKLVNKKDFDTSLFDTLINRLAQAGSETTALEAKIKNLFKNSDSRIIQDSIKSSLSNLHLTLGSQAEIDPDFKQKVEDKIRESLKDSGMDVEKFVVTFEQDENNNLKGMTATFSALNKEMHEAITLRAKFNEEGHFETVDEISYANTSGQDARREAEKEQRNIDSEYIKHTKEILSLENKIAELTAKNVYASQDDQNINNAKIAGLKEEIALEQKRRDALVASNDAIREANQLEHESLKNRIISVNTALDTEEAEIQKADNENAKKEQIKIDKEVAKAEEERAKAEEKAEKAHQKKEEAYQKVWDKAAYQKRQQEAKEQADLEKEIAKAEEERVKAEEKAAKEYQKKEEQINKDWQQAELNQQKSIQADIDGRYTESFDKRIKYLNKVQEYEAKIQKDPTSKNVDKWEKEIEYYKRLIAIQQEYEANLEHMVSPEALNKNANRLKATLEEIEDKNKALKAVYSSDSSTSTASRTTQDDDIGLKKANELLKERLKIYNQIQEFKKQKADLELDPVKNKANIDVIEKEIKSLIGKLKELKQEANLFESAGILDADSLKKQLDLQNAKKQSAKQKKDTENSNKILGKFDDSQIQALSEATDRTENYAKAVEKVQNQWAALRQYVNNNDLSDAGNMSKAIEMSKELEKALKDVDSDVYKNIDKNGRTYVKSFEGNIISVRGEVENLIKSYKGIDEASIRWAANQKSVTYSLQESSGQMRQYRAYLEQVNDVVQMRTVDMGAESVSSKIGRVLNAGVKTGFNTVGSFIGMYADINDLIQYASKGIDIFKEYDAALTDISYTTEGTRAQIDAMGESYVQLAKDMSASIADSMEVASIYANLQTSSEEVMQSVRPTLLLSNATGVDASDASDQIQGVLEQFDMATSESEHIVDVYESISSNLKLDFSKAIDAVSEGVSVAGQTAADAGLSFEQLAAVVGKVAEKTRDGGSEIGNSLKTMLTRISKASAMSDEVDNDTISKAAEALNAIGIKVYEADGSFRNFGTIITELQGKWEGLTDAQQSYLAYQIERSLYM